MESAGLTIENKNTGCRELEYQVLGTGVPDTGTTELRASLQKNTGARHD